jgi:uncharacterized protein (DUF924 family)
MTADTVEEIVSFWFKELKPEDWYWADTTRDAAIAKRFCGVYARLRAGVPPDWLDSPQGVLAAILVLDQFPRNMFRGKREAFATDAAALHLSKRAIEQGLDLQLPPAQRAFVYMPFQHSEAAADQARSITLFTALGAPLNLDFARRHRAVIDRFGRFPHRNAALGRSSTDEELAFLEEPGSSF